MFFLPFLSVSRSLDLLYHACCLQISLAYTDFDSTHSTSFRAHFVLLLLYSFLMVFKWPNRTFVVFSFRLITLFASKPTIFGFFFASQKFIERLCYSLRVWTKEKKRKRETEKNSNKWHLEVSATPKHQTILDSFFWLFKWKYSNSCTCFDKAVMNIVTHTWKVGRKERNKTTWISFWILNLWHEMLWSMLSILLWAFLRFVFSAVVVVFFWFSDFVLKLRTLNGILHYFLIGRSLLAPLIDNVFAVCV